MFLSFIKPKSRKNHITPDDYHFANRVHDVFFMAKVLSYCMWFLSIPFLLMAYSETISPFLTITIACVVSDFLEKVFHNEYKYF